MKKVLIISLLFLLPGKMLYAQSEAKIGLSGTVQSNQFGISIPVWLGEMFVLAPGLDLKYAETVGTDFSFGLSARYYLKKEIVCPYLGLKAGTAFFMPSSDNPLNDKSKMDLLGGIAFGIEYFVADKLSFGIEAQGNFTKSDKRSNRFGNPDGLNFNTATMLSATAYF
jgi:uncharacterized membrane protein (UPF0136 family)